MALDRGTLAALRIRMARVRVEIDRVEKAISEGSEMTGESRGRLAALRQERVSLQNRIGAAGTEGERSEPSGFAESIPSSAARERLAETFDRDDDVGKSVPEPRSGRDRRLLERRRRGVRHSIRLEIWGQDLDAMVEAGELTEEEAEDPVAVADAVEDIFDRWIRRRDLSDLSTGPRGSGLRLHVPEPVQPDAPPRPDRAPPVEEPLAEATSPDNRAGLDRRTGINRRDIQEQRNGMERRSGLDRRLGVLGWQGDADWRKEAGLERRASDDRRLESDRRSQLDRRTHVERRHGDERRII